MRGFTAHPKFWIGTFTLFALAFTMSGATLPATDAWYDQWRDYAEQTTLLDGRCTDAANVDDPQCDPNDYRFKLELWMIVPWLVSAGCLGSSLCIAWPFVRRRIDA